MPIPAQVCAQFWGVGDPEDSWGFGRFVDSQLYGGNVGHAALLLTLPYNEDNWEMVESNLKSTGIPYRKKHLETKKAVLKDGKVVKSSETAYEEDIIEVYFSWWPGNTQNFSFNTPAQDFSSEREGVDRPVSEAYADEMMTEQRVSHGLLADRIITLSPSSITHMTGLDDDERALIEAYHKLAMIEKTLSPWEVLINKLLNLKEKKPNITEKSSSSDFYSNMGATEKLLLSKLFSNENLENSSKSFEEILMDATQQEKILKDIRLDAQSKFNKALLAFTLSKQPITEADQIAFNKITAVQNVINLLDNEDNLDLEAIKKKIQELEGLGYKISPIFKNPFNQDLRKGLKQYLLQYVEPIYTINDKVYTPVQQDKLKWIKVSLSNLTKYQNQVSNITNEITNMLDTLKNPNQNISDHLPKIQNWIEMIDNMRFDDFIKNMVLLDLKSLYRAIDNQEINNTNLTQYQERLSLKLQMFENEIINTIHTITSNPDLDFCQAFGINDFLEDVVRAASKPDREVILPLQTKDNQTGLAIEPMLKMMQHFATEASYEFNLVDRNCSVTTKSILAAGAGKEKAWIFVETGELMGTLFNPQSVYNSALLYQKALDQTIKKPQPSLAEQIVGGILYPFSYAAVSTAAVVQSNDPVGKAKEKVNEAAEALSKYTASWVRSLTGADNSTKQTPEKTPEQSAGSEQTVKPKPGKKY